MACRNAIDVPVSRKKRANAPFECYSYILDRIDGKPRFVSLLAALIA